MTDSIYFITYDKHTKRLTSRGTCSRGELGRLTGLNDVAVECEANSTEAIYDEANSTVCYDEVATDKPTVPPTTQELWNEVKAKRNMLLSSCDWTQMPDVPQATQDLWKPYRQALRDITLQTDPANIVFPTPPV